MRRSLTTLILSLTIACAPAQEPVEVSLDASRTQGTWEAWGLSLAWWAAVFGDRDDLADALFTRKAVPIAGETVPGLDLNFVRYNAGASSWNEIDGREMKVSDIIFRYRQMEGFWLDPRQPDPDSKGWDWSVDAKQREMLAMARERGVDHFELFSNSPMWWMTRNDNPSGGAKPTDNNLARDQERNFAIYLAAIARRAADDWGQPFTTVSPFNEPLSEWWFENCKQEGCHVSPDQQARVLKLLREELDRRGLDELEITASEETYYDHAISSWRSFDEETRKLVDRVHVHGYQGANGDRAGLHQLVHVEGGKPLWNSEYGDGEASGLEMARNLHRDLARLKPTSWSYWQAVDGGGWGLVAADLRRPGRRWQVNPKWYVLAHYTRGIPPGASILQSDLEELIAAHDPREDRLTLVLLNDGDQDREIRVRLEGFAFSEAESHRWTTEPNGETAFHPEAGPPLEDDTVSILVPRASVVSTVIDGVRVR